jgi:glycerophosphoryl diester phosphodiesterase
MLILYLAIFVAVAMAVTYVFLIMPRTFDAADMDLQSTDYASRGLCGKEAPPNGMTAFLLARDAGYGIALDVALTSDKRVVTACRAKRAPLLSEVLSATDGHVPILITVPPSSNSAELCRSLCELLDPYPGAFAIQSADPRVLSFFKKYRPRYARGQIVAPYRKYVNGKMGLKCSRIKALALSLMLTNALSRPDFISLDRCKPTDLSVLTVTRLFHAKCFLWTVRSDAQYALCRRRACYAIFEGIRPL